MFSPAAVFAGLALLIVAVEIWRPKSAIYDFMFFFNLTYLIYFCVAPIHVLVGGVAYANLTGVYHEHLAPAEAATELRLALLVVSAYLMALLGFLSRTARSCGSSLVLRWPGRRSLGLIAIGFGIIGLAALLAYAQQFTGLTDVILSAALIRSGVETGTGGALFVKHFIPFVQAVSLVVLVLMLTQPRPGARRWLLALFLCSVVLALLSAVIEGSRRSILIFTAAMYFIIANWTGRRHGMALVMLTLLFFAVLIVGDQILIGLSQGAAAVQERLAGLGAKGPLLLYQAVWRDLSLPFMEFAGVFSRFEGWPRWFMDFPLAILDIVPRQLLPLELPPSLLEESTRLLTGRDVGVIAGVPPGFLGYLWYSGLLAGLLVGAWAFGWIAALLESALRIRLHAQPAALLVYNLVGFTWAYSTRMGVPGMLLTERFHWFALIAVLMLGARISLPRARQALQSGGVGSSVAAS